MLILVYVWGCLYMYAYVCLAVHVSVAALVHALDQFLQVVFYYEAVKAWHAQLPGSFFFHCVREKDGGMDGSA